MNKETKLTDKYKQNKKVQITVVNEPFIPEEGGKTYYKRTVTLKVNAGTSEEQLSFNSADQIAKYFEDLDYEDPQQSLL